MIIFFPITFSSVRLWSHSEQEAQQHLDHMQLGYCTKDIHIWNNMTTIIKFRHVTTSHLFSSFTICDSDLQKLNFRQYIRLCGTPLGCWVR